MRKFVTCIVAAVCAWTLAYGQAKSILQRNAFFVTQPNVAGDLQLSSAQIARRAKILEAYNAKREALSRQLGSQSTEADVQRFRREMAEAQAQAESQMVQLLAPQQQRRLKQIAIQFEGTDALLDSGVALELGLNATQMAKIKKIADSVSKAQEAYQEALGEALAKLPDPDSDDPQAIKAYTAKQDAVIKSLKPQEKRFMDAKKAGDQQKLAVLNTAQAKKWQAMQGKPLKPGS